MHDLQDTAVEARTLAAADCAPDVRQECAALDSADALRVSGHFYESNCAAFLMTATNRLLQPAGSSSELPSFHGV
jgi:hypothetical protein